MNEILRCSASQFDPDVTGVFTERIDGWLQEQRDLGTKVPE